MKKAEINKLDDIARARAYERTGGTCEVLHCDKNAEHHRVNWHHYITRKNRALRWVQENIFIVCAGHHTLGNDSFHLNPIWGRDMAKLLRGTAWESKIRKLSNHINKHDYDTNLELMTMSLDRLLKFYESPLDSVAKVG